MERETTLFADYLKMIINDATIEVHVPYILKHFTFTQLKKNAFLVEEHTVCNSFSYIVSGILQHSITVNDEEKTTYLALKNSCVSSLKSFINKSKSRKNIKALSDCTLWSINHEGFHFLLKENQAFNRFYYNLIERQIYFIDDHRIDLLTLSPEERYQKLLENDPKLLQQVPLRYLSSFLGISLRSMSRIRKNSN